MKAKVDYNDIMGFKKELEQLYVHFENTHKNMLKFLEDAECIDDEKVDEFHSHIKEYESKLETLKSDFYQLSSEQKKLESCLNQTKILKKRRVTKLESNMKKPKINDILDECLGEWDDCEDCDESEDETSF